MFISAVDENGKNVLDDKKGMKFFVLADDGSTLHVEDSYKAAEDWLNENPDAEMIPNAPMR